MYGIVAGLITALWLIINFSVLDSNFELAEFFGYASMIIAFSTIFFAVRSIRTKNGGNITFGKAFQIGLGITLTATVIYIIAWMIISNTIAKDFMDQYVTQSIEKLQISGIDQAEIDKKIIKLNQMKEMYKNPLVKIGMTFLEIFPVGFLVTLISAFLLKKNN